MKKIDYITFGKPLITKNQFKEIYSTLESGWIGTGPKVRKFENLFSKYKNIDNSIAVNSCTAALHLSLLNLNLKNNDEVLVPALTFCSTINAVIHSNLKPVLVDVDNETMNIDVNEIKKKITKKTKAIIVVHLAGLSCDMKSIMSLADRYNLKVVEDCAHAIEGKYFNKPLGTFGDFGCFSFYVTKNITTAEGGMIITSKKANAKKIKSSALHGLSKDAWSRFSDKGYNHYYVNDLGFKYNMTDLNASLGIDQIKNIHSMWLKRKKVWDLYHKSFSNLKIKLPYNSLNNIKHSYHLFTIRINKKNNKNNINRDAFIQLMHKNKIGTGVHYLSIPEHPYYKSKYKWKVNDFPIAKRIGRETVSLPLSPYLKKNQLSYIIKNVKNILG
jgi:dTDP-4-amino-4,6-dideoxygalactose transaminase